MIGKESDKTSRNEDVSFEIVLEKRERSFSYGEPRVTPIIKDQEQGVNPESIRERIRRISTLDIE